MKHYILANPFSGRKKGEKIAINVQKLLKKNNIDAEVIMSKYPRHLTEVTKELSSKEDCRFYVIGGDGTLNEAVSGMIGTNSEVVVIPGGTGNDFVKSVSKYMSMRKIVLSSIGKQATPTDIIKINNDRYCINVLNSGFDALVASNLDKFRNVPLISGKMKYTLAIFYTLLTNRNYYFKLRADNKVLKKNFTLVAIANGKYYGGGVIPCPDANVNDGILDICSISSTSVRQKIFFLPSYNKGTHINNPLVTILKSNKIHLVSKRLSPVSIDGEIIHTKKLNVSVLKDAIKIVHID